MKKMTAMAMGMVVAMLTSSLAFAGGSEPIGDITVTGDVRNTITNTATSAATSTSTATGGNARATGGNASINRSGNSSIRNSGNSSIRNSGNSAVKNSGNATLVNNEVRQMITAQPGPSGTFVTGVAVATADCVPLFGQGLYKTFSIKRINKMADSGGMLEGKGGWFHSMFTSDINAVPYEAFEGKADGRSITLIDWEPIGNMVYPGDEILGEVNCSGDYGWPLGSVLGKCLASAKQTTNTTRVFACVSLRTDSKTSGLSYGSGGAASKMMGPAASGSLALAGLIGTTTSFADTAFDVKIIALNDGRTEWYKEEVYVAPPPPAPVVIPCPPAVCDPSEFLRLIIQAEREIAGCYRYCHNNMFWRLVAARNNVNAWLCTGDARYLSAAINHYEMAELNYLHGQDIKRYADSESVIAEVEFGLASAFYARDGSIGNFYHAPKVVVHEDKKRHTDKPVGLTSDEKKRVLELRNTLERYSKKLSL